MKLHRSKSGSGHKPEHQHEPKLERLGPRPGQVRLKPEELDVIRFHIQTAGRLLWARQHAANVKHVRRAVHDAAARILDLGRNDPDYLKEASNFLTRASELESTERQYLSLFINVETGRKVWDEKEAGLIEMIRETSHGYEWTGLSKLDEAAKKTRRCLFRFREALKVLKREIGRVESRESEGDAGSRDVSGLVVAVEFATGLIREGNGFRDIKKATDRLAKEIDERGKL